ncbi:MAG: hypothetical protein V1744_01785 [Candidatus Altiarchaeota archaeon]
MKLDLTPVYLAFGIGLATYLVLRLKKVTPDVKFKDVKYDKLKNEIQLLVENISDDRIYVKPALRVVRLASADEWRQNKVNASQIPMMMASAGSVIKGYELVGEYADPVAVEPKMTAVIRYPVMRDFGLKAYDNIKVDSPIGNDPYNMNGSATGTVRMTLNELTSEELADLLSERETPDAKKAELTVAKSDFPVSALCYCCGKEQMLRWIAGGNHVCDGCKNYLVNEAAVSVNSIDAGDMEEEYGPSELNVGIELIDTQPVDLKPRHKKILNILGEENTASAKELANKLERGHKSVAEDLRYLLKNNLIDRVKISGKYKYFSVRESEQVILHNQDEETFGQLKWT